MPSEWDPDATRHLFGGFQYNADNGVYFGAGVTYTASYYLHRRDFTCRKTATSIASACRCASVITRACASSPPPAATVQPGAPTTPPAPANRPPTVKARCEPCTVEVGRTAHRVGRRAGSGRRHAALSLDSADRHVRQPRRSPDAVDRARPGGRRAADGDRGRRQGHDGDGYGDGAGDCAGGKKQITFEDVHFDFDRYTLRAEATRILDEAIKAMTEDPNLRITVEGHTCNIGTTEYNLALGERRSSGGARLPGQPRRERRTACRSVSYGEERPKHDNSREETRRLNRRAAMTIRLQ